MGRATVYPRARIRPRALHAELARQDESIVKFATRIGLSRTTVSAIAQGRDCPLETAQKLATGLGVKVEKLFVVTHQEPAEQLRLPVERPAALEGGK